MKQITFKQYRSIDLTIICVLTAGFELLVALATNRWFVAQPMAVSLLTTMICIAMMRWNAYALIPALSGSIMYCIALGANLSQYVIYCGGSLFTILALPILKKLGKDEVRKDFFKRVVFITSTFVLMILGRWICSLPFDFKVNSLITFFTTDILSLLFAWIVVSVAKNGDGLIEDQKSYLLRLEEERKAEQEKFFDDNFQSKFYINYIITPIGDSYEEIKSS